MQAKKLFLQKKKTYRYKQKRKCLFSSPSWFNPKFSIWSLFEMVFHVRKRVSVSRWKVYYNIITCRIPWEQFLNSLILMCHEGVGNWKNRKNILCKKHRYSYNNRLLLLPLTANFYKYNFVHVVRSAYYKIGMRNIQAMRNAFGLLVLILFGLHGLHITV